MKTVATRRRTQPIHKKGEGRCGILNDVTAEHTRTHTLIAHQVHGQSVAATVVAGGMETSQSG